MQGDPSYWPIELDRHELERTLADDIESGVLGDKTLSPRLVEDDRHPTIATGA